MVTELSVEVELRPIFVFKIIASVLRKIKSVKLLRTLVEKHLPSTGVVLDTRVFLAKVNFEI